jgi:hypothetical protein
MDDQPRQADQQPSQEWLDALARADADVAAGRTVAWSDVRARLLARLAEMEAKQARRRA